MPFTRRSSGLCQVIFPHLKAPPCTQPCSSFLSALWSDTLFPSHRTYMKIWEDCEVERVVFFFYQLLFKSVFPFSTARVCFFSNFHILWRMGKKSFTNMGVKGRCTKRGNLWFLTCRKCCSIRSIKNLISVGIISSQMFFFSQFESQFKKLLVDSFCLYMSLGTCWLKNHQKKKKCYF